MAQADRSGTSQARREGRRQALSVEQSRKRHVIDWSSSWSVRTAVALSDEDQRSCLGPFPWAIPVGQAARTRRAARRASPLPIRIVEHLLRDSQKLAAFPKNVLSEAGRSARWVNRGVGLNHDRHPNPGRQRRSAPILLSSVSDAKMRPSDTRLSFRPVHPRRIAIPIRYAATRDPIAKP